MTYQDVVITGMGLTTAGACSPRALFERIKSGNSCIKVNEKLAALGFPYPVAASLDPHVWDLVHAKAAAGNDQHTRLTELSLFTAEQAIAQSGIDHRDGRAGVFMASNWLSLDMFDLTQTIGSLNDANSCVDLDFLCRTHEKKGGDLSQYRRDRSAMVLAERFGFFDTVMTSSDACAAGSIAIGTAYRYIRHGQLDIAIAGGTELMCELLPFLCFNSIGITYSQPRLDPAAIFRPFDRDRNGFVLGEGSAFLVLESAEHARARRAKPLARITGFAKYSEANNVLASTEDGSEFARCMKGALKDADMTAEHIDHINAHGTATVSNDACEAKAISQVFGSRTPDIPVTANKSFVGHAIAASGAIEAVLSVLSLQDGMLLPTLNYETPDQALPLLDIVTAPRAAGLRTIMSNSFGLGGENCSLILTTV